MSSKDKADEASEGNEEHAEPSSKKPRVDDTVPEPTGGDQAKPTSRKLDAGELLPELPSLESDDSTEAGKKKISISEVAKESGVIIFIYPRANTPGCTNQACGFRDNYEGIKEGGYQIFGLSADKPKSQASWKAKQSLPFTLLYDMDMEAIRALGANKGERGISRTHLVVEKGGKILQVMYDVKPKDSVNAAVQLVTGKPAIPQQKALRRPTVYEEDIDEDEPPKSKIDEMPRGKRQPKPSTKKVMAEQDALELGDVGDEDEEEEDDDDAPKKRGRGRGRGRSSY